MATCRCGFLFVDATIFHARKSSAGLVKSIFGLAGVAPIFEMTTTRGFVFLRYTQLTQMCVYIVDGFSAVPIMFAHSIL